MGYSSEMSFDAAKLEKLLRHAKVTQQSIQAVSTWILDRRGFLPEMVELWNRLLLEGDAGQQIVCLYIANDTMQVGARKYGKHIAEMFEPTLLPIVERIMAEGEEKVKRCIIKIIGIWKERNMVKPDILKMLQNVCAGKPAVEPTDEPDAPSADEQVTAAKEAFLRELESEATRELVLQDMHEVIESAETTALNQHLQNLVTATISADLLSDRMFQLESSLTTFHHAVEAYQSPSTGPDAEDVVMERSAGDIVWEMMDQQVFDVDIDRSREHVQQYRDNLEEQNAKRDELLDHLRSLTLLEPFDEPIYKTSGPLHDQQAEAVERLYELCLRAEVVEARQAAERRAAYSSRPPVHTHSGLQSPQGHRPVPTGLPHEYSPRDPYARRDSLPSTSAYEPRALPQRRYSSSGYDDGMYDNGGAPKRPKLMHSHSAGEDSRYDRRDRPSRWHQPPPSRDNYPYEPQPNYDNHRYEDNRYGNRYDDRYARSPRHSQSSRWDARPEYDDRRDRRW